ncbi:FAD-binding domain-containing protein [Paraphoma chrysanthemicola]|nr:FAD-binding domain-containing protein [Paraphoma chrysanthemicola]
MAQQQYLTDKEIKDFIDDLDHDNNGWIDYSEVERMLDEVHKEIAPKPQPHHLHHASRGDEARHEFLRSVIGTREDRIKRENFEECVKKWQIPSLEQDRKEAKYEDDYLKHMTVWRRIRAFWAVKGPEIAFLALVASFMIAFGVWQFVKYLTTARYTAAFGWGAVLSKTCAGVLYPTFFFLILSMSRWLSTFLRRFYFISRFVNWDLSQSFHIKMSITALVFATLHAIGHLSGSFVFGSSASRQDAVAVIVGQEGVPRYYIDYVRSVPGWTGLTAIGCFYLLTAMSMPQIRKWSYEVFQLGHLLMFPIIGLMMAHGTAGLLQWPMFGYWLAFPTLLVIFERSWRFILGFRPIEADLEFLDDETTAITAEVPTTRPWDYKAGQYVFVQVPQISRFQWHPFTVSTCIHNRMQVHIKADGDWTNKLRDLAKKGEKTKIKIGLDGPFGAPAQRFYDFEYSMVFGAGIGVTPFSGVLTDLQHHELERTMSGEHSPESADGTVGEKSSPYENHRRVDFHWMVRDKNNLMWFSDLLNQVSRAQELDSSHLDIRIQTYVTQKRKNISQHVFRWLLEKHRTDDHPFSPITGLVNPTHFGRPDIKMILEEHYSDMCKVLGERTSIKEKIRPDGRRSSRVRRNSAVDNEVRVGVFFCGPPVIGQQLADQCEQMTAKARNEGRKIEYRFMIEVFG